MEYTRARWNTLGKPLHSLGRLEEMVTQFAGIYRDKNPHLRKKAVIVMAADNGVVAEGVTQTGQEVTKTVTENMTKHNATICIMSSMSGADVYPVDIGIATDCDNPGVFPRKIKYGTDNMAKGPAMSREEAVKAIEVGISMVADLKEKGYNPTLINARFAYPMDSEYIKSLAKNHRYIFTLEDNILSGGFGEHFTMEIVNSGEKSCSVFNFAFPNAYIEQGSREQLFEKYGMDKEHILEKILKRIED